MRRVTRLNEMARGCCRSLRVGRGDGVDLDPVGRAVHEHDGCAAFNLGEEVALVLADRAQDQAVNTSAQKLSNNGAFSLRVLVQTGREHGHALGQQDVFHRSVELPSKRIVNTADE
jgi:hypothetical protein